MRTYVLDRAAERPHSLPPGDRAPSTVDGRGRGPRAPEPPARGRAPAPSPCTADQVSPKYERDGAALRSRLPRRGLPTLEHFPNLAMNLARSSAAGLRRPRRFKHVPEARRWSACRSLRTVLCKGGWPSLQPTTVTLAEDDYASASRLRRDGNIWHRDAGDRCRARADHRRTPRRACPTSVSPAARIREYRSEATSQATSAK